MDTLDTAAACATSAFSSVTLMNIKMQFHFVLSFPMGGCHQSRVLCSNEPIAHVHPQHQNTSYRLLDKLFSHQHANPAMSKEGVSFVKALRYRERFLLSFLAEAEDAVEKVKSKAFKLDRGAGCQGSSTRSEHVRRLRREDRLSPEVQDQPGQHGENLCLQKIQNLVRHGSTCL
ncbi:hypothetical protein AAY473_016214 [Plecturocebus cupreus]